MFVVKSWTVDFVVGRFGFLVDIGNNVVLHFLGVGGPSGAVFPKKNKKPSNIVRNLVNTV